MDLITLALARKHVSDAVTDLGHLVKGDHDYNVAVKDGQDGDTVSFDADEGVVELTGSDGEKKVVANYWLTDGIEENDILNLFEGE